MEMQPMQQPQYPYPMQVIRPQGYNSNNNMIVINQTGQPINMGQEGHLDDVSKAVIDVNIAQTFGAAFFNTQDPYYLEHKNVPRRVENSIHLWVLLLNLYMIGSIAGGVVCYLVQAFPTSPVVGPAMIIAQGYLIYIIVAICCSESRKYIMNVKPYTEYQNTYNGMVQGKPYFQFYITCYHYETRRDSKGRSRQVKVTTHTANEQYTPSEWVDESGVIQEIQETKNYVFLKCNSRFYFGNPSGQARYNGAWSRFLSMNTRDTHQDKSSTFRINNFEEEIGFTARGMSSHSIPFFFLFTFLGLGYPYSIILETTVARYEINILKNITG